MENRRENLGFVKVCRFCLAQNRPLVSLYEKCKSKSTVTLPLKILTSVSIEVLPSDKKPTYICDRCKFFMNIFYEYKYIVRQADESILHTIQNGAPLATINWPSSLSKIFRHITEPETVKTVVEGGATIQVTSHNVSDTDEEDGNVYNIKIGDDEDTKACVKVVTSKDVKAKENARGKDAPVVEEGKEERTIAEGCYPCDECDCTYPLEQLLDLHKMKKHRSRDVACNQCDAKFFTKYDLATHQLRHSVDTPFQCVACGKKFKRLILLKRHEKMIHPDLPQLMCLNCPATFLSIEELNTHQKKHVRVQKHPCTQCDKKFQEKSALQRHIDVVHNKEATLRCEYCPERFGSISKLARHVRTHVGERPYPCKYCEKSFTKSHHYTRHLRLLHRQQTRPDDGAGATDQEQYRCDQCEDVFESQDDLIYHSAIHATQNLTCPLCQEKFQDVEAVTAHIKSHVNGVEFMCDYCELIFTTQEKLDAHQLMVHDDEMQNDESSMELELEDEEDDNGINVKEEGDDMIIEIKKPDNYRVNNIKEHNIIEEKMDNTNSEESESEVTYTELQTVDTLAILTKDVKSEPVTPEKVVEKPAAAAAATTATTLTANNKIVSKTVHNQTANTLRKPEEIKRKVFQTPDESDAVITKKSKTVAKVESSNSGGASDKSLRLLEKELQDLKRTNSRNTETNKASANKVLETPKTKRPQLQTSTPKLRSADDRKQLTNKSLSVERKQPEKRAVTKENKEPKETKEVKNSYGSSKEDKDNREKEKDKDSNEKDTKEKEKDKGKVTPKSIMKNGSANERSSTEEGVRRSTRPSKIKDYAKMIRDRADDSDDDTTEDDDDYCEKTTESRRPRRPTTPAKPVPVKIPPAATPTATPATPKRKRGRPRKEPKEVPEKMKKQESEDAAQESNTTISEKAVETTLDVTSTVADNDQSGNKTPEPTDSPPTDVMVSPLGQTLKKVRVGELPPGVKAVPLSATVRSRELCEMQIGTKLVKVQKIVMTKAEVEAMAKKGLVEMKDGTMLLKQGIKLSAAADAAPVKSTAVADGDAVKEFKKDSSAPTRCDLGDES